MKLRASASMLALVFSVRGAYGQTAVECAERANGAQVDRDEGRLLQARESLRQCASPACPEPIRSDCVAWLTDVERRIPTVAIRVQEGERDVTNATLTVDGRPVKVGREVPLDPGAHSILVRHGGRDVARDVVLVEGEVNRVVVVDVPTSQPSSTGAGDVPRGVWLVGGAGLLALAAGSYFWVKAAGLHSDFEACAPDCADVASDGKRAALAGDLLTGAGVAAIAGAVVWWQLTTARPRVGVTSSSRGSQVVGAQVVVSGAF